MISVHFHYTNSHYAIWEGAEVIGTGTIAKCHNEPSAVLELFNQEMVYGDKVLVCENLPARFYNMTKASGAKTSEHTASMFSSQGVSRGCWQSLATMRGITNKMISQDVWHKLLEIPQDHNGSLYTGIAGAYVRGTVSEPLAAAVCVGAAYLVGGHRVTGNRAANVAL